ncbi:MAG: hypothetical protein HY055_09270 [Magnetospirillum sp.]|nr:hypothetical protein [Magnetospirillum sp.]
MIATDLTTSQITIIGLNLVTGCPTAHFSPWHGDDWLIIARVIEAAYLDGERLHLGCLSGHVIDIEDWRQCQADQPGAYTVFGYDHAAGEALAIQTLAATAADALHQALLSQPGSFQAAGVAAGFHEWAPGSTWQALAARTIPTLSCA